MELKKNINLKNFNTFGIEAFARYFFLLEKESEILPLFQNHIFKKEKHLFLGGGSNTLFTKNFDGVVVQNNLKGIEVVEEDDKCVLVRSMGGESWHDLVSFVTDKDWWGIENLSFIPGTVGAAPMQNIGAYGTELCDTLYEVEAYEIKTGEKKIFKNKECNFGYRNSIFKNSHKDNYFISAIILKLSKEPKINTEYKVLKEYLTQNNLEIKTSKDVANAVEAIRRSKLPDPKILGNAGSFFKNVVVSSQKKEELLKNYPNMPHFPDEAGEKIPTAWLIEQCGFKGKRFGSVGVHDKQALVLVNHGGATGKDILNLAQDIISAVEQKFGITITPEVNFV